MLLEKTIHILYAQHAFSQIEGISQNFDDLQYEEFNVAWGCGGQKKKKKKIKWKENRN